jgi:hypothetical protein
MSQDADRPRRSRLFRAGRSPRTRSVVVATGLLVVVLAPAGVAATGSVLKEGVRNGTATRETQIISKAPATTGLTGGYATRQSNLSDSGGGAVYGCRSTSGGSTATPPRNPCIRSNNLATGFAFEFNATNGTTVGTINAGSGGDTKRPFTTNATGVATGLNADRVDGQNATDIAKTATDAAAADATTKANAAKERWALVDPSGTIIRQTGGFKTVNCYQDNANCYIDAGEDVTNNAITTQVLTANNPDAGTDGQLSGEASASPCAFDFVNCAPAGTDTGNGGNAGVLVVAPRNSDGTTPDAGDRYAFYVKVSAAQSTP